MVSREGLEKYTVSGRLLTGDNSCILLKIILHSETYGGNADREIGSGGLQSFNPCVYL